MYYLEVDRYGRIEEFSEVPSYQEAEDAYLQFINSQFGFHVCDDEGNEIGLELV